MAYDEITGDMVITTRSTARGELTSIHANSQRIIRNTRGSIQEKIKRSTQLPVNF